MGVDTLVPVEQYLRTDYSPDREYVDGALVERNVGERPHSLVQSNLIFVLRRNYPGLKVWPELRLRISPSRFRIPDVCVPLERPATSVLEQAPFIAIEILSPDDRITDLLDKLQEYHRIGTPHIWVFDPGHRKAFTFDGGALAEVTGEAVETAEPRVRLTLAEIFEE